MKNLSGGELQRVAITMALGQPANVYLIDEPSAYLDSEQRIVAAKVRQFPVMASNGKENLAMIRWCFLSCEIQIVSSVRMHLGNFLCKGSW